MKKYLLSIVSIVATLLTLSSFKTTSQSFNDQIIKEADTTKKIIKDTIAILNANIEDAKLKKETYSLVKELGGASYYHDKFNGRRTASGKRFNNNELTAAHKKLPFGTKIKVTNPKNNKSVIVTVTDRGPFVKGRELDLSKRAFKEITHSKKAGVINVKIEKINTKP